MLGRRLIRYRRGLVCHRKGLYTSMHRDVDSQGGDRWSPKRPAFDLYCASRALAGVGMLGRRLYSKRGRCRLEQVLTKSVALTHHSTGFTLLANSRLTIVLAFAETRRHVSLSQRSWPLNRPGSRLCIAFVKLFDGGRAGTGIGSERARIHTITPPREESSWKSI